MPLKLFSCAFFEGRRKKQRNRDQTEIPGGEAGEAFESELPQPASAAPVLDDQPEDSVTPIRASPSQRSGDGLVVAMAVDEHIYAAVEYDPDSIPPQHRNRHLRVYACMALMVIVAVVAVTVVYVAKIINKSLDYSPTTTPTNSPTTSPTDREASGIKEQIEAGVLQRNATFKDINKSDPKYLALDWLLHIDKMQLPSDDKHLYQRYILALIAFSLDSLAWFFCGDHRAIVGNETASYVAESCVVQDLSGQIDKYTIWLSSTDECDWYGVVCSKDGLVLGLELIENNLIGEIPAEICELRNAQYIAFNANCLHGTLPPEMGKMAQLQSLELQGNGLSGVLPNGIYDASELQVLNLAYQYGYYSECASSNGTVVNTYYVKGDINNGQNFGIEGGLSHQIKGWSSLKILHLSDNSLIGPIPSEVGDLKYLVFLHLQNNAISGEIPNDLAKLDKLRELHLYETYVYGALPANIGLLEDLEDLRLHGNEMWGEIPASFYALTKMKKVWFQNTLLCDVFGRNCFTSDKGGFQGSLAKEIGNMAQLNQLLLNNNPLTGELPSELGLCEALGILHIHQTQIRGTVPIEVCRLRDKNLNTNGFDGGFFADCFLNNGTQDPFLRCDCCTVCCDHTTKVCFADD